MPQVTVVTPIGPRHVGLYQRARESALATSWMHPVELLSAVDHDGRGPGAVRNYLLRQVTTEYVVFLDADDWLEPDFIERTLDAALPYRYVYTDWYQDGEVRASPDRPWCNGTFHLVTCLVPTQLALEVGGFDEGLRGMEDTDFFIRLSLAGHCGVRVPVPLVHYSANGGRADVIHENGSVEKLRATLTQRYGDKKMACCGDPPTSNNSPVGAQQPGDVLATALWGGNRAEFGRATNRRYPRTSWPHRVWVDPRDVAAAPHLWQVIPEAAAVPPEPPPDAEAAFVSALGFVGTAPRPADGARPVAPPDFARINALTGATQTGGPIFVRPAIDYPSYSDFWRLVNLAGFRTMGMTEIRTEWGGVDPGDQTFIVVTPGDTGIWDGAKSRVVFWQLEYTGEYTNQPGKGTIAEHWSSDPAHAARTGSKFVLLGSDARLALPIGANEEYDFVMLAYMTARREAIKAKLVKAGLSTPAEQYPGHDNSAKAAQLSSSRLMVAVHQNDEPAFAPLRIALAAAYSLPVLSEEVEDVGPYGEGVLFAPYKALVKDAKKLLKAPNLASHGAALHRFLCERRTFRACVEGALT